MEVWDSKKIVVYRPRMLVNEQVKLVALDSLFWPSMGFVQ